MRFVSLVGLLLVGTSFAWAQNAPRAIATGLKPDDMAVINSKKAKGSVPVVTGGQAAGARLPTPLDRYLPYVLDQGSQGSCTAFAVAEALSIRENLLLKKARPKVPASAQVLFSPTYIWVIGNKGRPASEKCDSNGISYSDAFMTIGYNDLVDWKSYPYPLDNNDLCHTKCPDDVMAKKIRGRKFTFQDVRLDVSSFKNLLNRGFPICIATDLDLGFYNSTGKWEQKLQSAKTEHAMVIVDYDDHKRYFKVLDSHGDQSGDHGFIWLSYNLVNHDLDKGVVTRAYIVSYEKEAIKGPSGDIMLTSAASSDMTILAKLLDTGVSGKVVDKTGESLPGVSISVAGTTTATVSDINGNFNLKAPPNADLVVSNIGYTSKSFKLPERVRTVYNDNKYVTFTKQGYFRIFNGVRIGVVDLDNGDQSVLLSVTDDTTGELLTNNIQMTSGETVNFEAKGKQFQIKLAAIKHAGSLLNIGNWYAAFLEYALISDTEKLTQYF